MKKLFSSTLSLLTAMAIIPSNVAISAYADAIDMIPVDAEITEEICIGDLADLELSYPDLPDVASNFADGTYNYSQFLDDNNKLVYNALKPLVSEPSLTPITVKLKNPVSITLSTLPSSPDISEEELSGLDEQGFLRLLNLDALPETNEAVKDAKEQFTNLQVTRTDTRRTYHDIHTVVHSFLDQGEIERLQIIVQAGGAEA